MLLAATEVVGHGGRSGGGPGPFLIILLIGLLGFFLVKRQRYRKGGGGRHGASPMAHLQQRFASGEIGQAEFEHRRGVLRGDKNIPSAPADMAPPHQSAQEPPPPSSDDLD